ncbi:uncharacterized protein LOC136075566 [Hydra vulgaris]|uniref:Uncharacterized protein LOC136075566 n=1 Tax=Hydra vulgaris TaxID=6087 RepID=A0ABM4B8F7_HYDVU
MSESNNKVKPNEKCIYCNRERTLVVHLGFGTKMESFKDIDHWAVTIWQRSNRELPGTGADINEFELAELSGTGADINEFELAVAESAGTLLALPGTGADIIDIVSEFELALAVADTETLLAVLQNSVIFLFLFNNSFN